MPAMTVAMLLAAGVPHDVYDWFVRTHGADAVSAVRAPDYVVIALRGACSAGRLAFTGCIENSDGTRYWYRDGKLHRDDGPAIENSDGTRYWFRDGNRHRDDGPAIEFDDGTRAWYRNGKRHRDGGPAVEYGHGTRFWFRDGTQINPPKEK